MAHADRTAPFVAYCRGLILPGQRTSIEPIAARVRPEQVSAAHRSLHHLTAKAAWSEKEAAYKLCQAQERVADAYRKEVKGEGKTPPQPVPSGECSDPGPAPTPASQRPLEASEAHSPPGKATSPPSTNTPAADVTGPKKAQ